MDRCVASEREITVRDHNRSLTNEMTSDRPSGNGRVVLTSSIDRYGTVTRRDVRHIQAWTCLNVDWFFYFAEGTDSDEEC